MITAGLMPVQFDPAKSNRWGSLDQLWRLCDLAIVLNDYNPGLAINGGLTEIVSLGATHNIRPPWPDYANRMTLLARALAHCAEWVCWLDDDETLLKMTAKKLRKIIEEADSKGCVLVSFRKLEMWSETEARVDGIWGRKRKVVLQKNPFMFRRVDWANDWFKRLHAPPHQVGSTYEVEDVILHHGMSTPLLRRERWSKYQREDPDKKYQPMGYDYLLDETGMELMTV